MSHEIRTPLSLVRGAAELLAEETPGPLNPTQAMFVSTIAENTRLVIDMAEDFLLATRFHTGTVTVHPEPLDIRAIVSETAREVRRFLGTEIHVDAAGGILPMESDERLVRQMVWNLVNNAARHAGHDSVITLRIRERSEGGCLLSVIDDGVGLSDEEQRRLFEPFATGSSRRPGSGLGMMVVQQIVSALGGRIMIDSDTGVGTAVMIQLPARAPVEQKGAA
ncbi:MAG: HAMP domain-containing sensor histidine kinase [Ancrocorticia sp.]